MSKKIDILAAQIKKCKLCSLHKTRINAVPGEGDAHAPIMFIGEAPGAQEDAGGRPFCGRSGQVLSQLLEGVGIDRRKVFITSILKCRPPNNRNPKSSEIKACTRHLVLQIEAIAPKIVCCLGNFSLRYIFSQFGLRHQIKGVGQLHGKTYKAQLGRNKILIIALYHPASVVYNKKLEPVLKRDFRKVKNEWSKL